MLTEENKIEPETADPSIESMSGDTPGSQEVKESGVEGTEQDELTRLRKAVEDHKDKYLRLYAEFDNYKRRTSREKIELVKTAGQEIISELIGVLDDFDRAQKIAVETENSGVYPNGMRLVHHKLSGILHNKGLTSMNSTGNIFDPELHEAIAEIPSPSDELVGKVVDTVEKGYILSDKIIRFAKVVVGK